MFKVAILDDYQNVSQEFVDLKKLSNIYEIAIFSEPFSNEDDAIKQLKDLHNEILPIGATYWVKMAEKIIPPIN